MVMRKRLPLFAGLIAVAAMLPATTLERLSLDEMAAKSTAIVRGRVVSSRPEFRGPVIYTHFTIQVLERWKGAEAARVEVAVPGGAALGQQQTFAGAPELAPGGEYVLFLWTGKSGMTHLIGLSQGVFSLKSDGKGGMVAARSASSEAMLDTRTGRIVNDVSVRVGLGELRSRVAAALSRGE